MFSKKLTAALGLQLMIDSTAYSGMSISRDLKTNLIQMTFPQNKLH
jgi:hypothetical protein